MRDPVFIRGEAVRFDEDRYREFKEIRGRNAVDTIKNTADRYAVAYLDGAGGSVYWGIQDKDHMVVGVPLDGRERDELRKGVDAKLRTIQPFVDPAAFTLTMHPVVGDTPEPIPNLHVIELAVAPRPIDGLHVTEGRDAYIKTDSGTAKLSWEQTMETLRQRWWPQPDLRVVLTYTDQVGPPLTLPYVVVAKPSEQDVDDVLAMPHSLVDSLVSQESRDRFAEQYRTYIEQYYHYRDELSRSFIIGLQVRNDGTCPADTAVVELVFPDGIVVRSRSNLKEPKEPQYPVPPVLGVYALARQHGPAISTPWLRRPAAEPEPENKGPLFDRHTPGKVRYEFTSVLHDDPISMPAFVMQVPATWAGQEIEVVCRTKARQQRATRETVLSLTFGEKQDMTLSPYGAESPLDRARARTMQRGDDGDDE